jgi:uncharacterized membrane protein YcaP (DUF421 family)
MFAITGSGLFQIVLRTAIIYILVLVGVRLAGKREVGQMTPFDLVLLLLLSNSVQNAMTGPDTSLIGGIVAAITLFLLNTLVADVAGVNRRFRRVVQGSPSMLIHDGQVLIDHMAKEHVSADELERALREHGIVSAKEVAIGVLEVDGSMSFLKYDDVKEGRNPHKRRFVRKPE